MARTFFAGGTRIQVGGTAPKSMIEVANDKEVMRKLRKMGKLGLNITVDAMLDGAEVIRKQVAQNAPRPSKRRHPDVGRLADNIIKTIMYYGTGKAIVGIMPDYRESRVGHLVEFGHKMVRGSHVFGEVPDHPFFRPGFDATKDIAIQVIRGSLRKSIDRETRKLNKG